MTGNGAPNRRVVKLKRKSLVGLLAMGLLVMVPVLSACGSVTEANDGNYLDTPHAFTGGFENCFICHTGGQSAIPPAESELVPRHSQFPLEMCTRPECHAVTEEAAVSLAALERAE